MKNQLDAVLALPEFSTYEEYGADDYRMAGVANPSFSISSKGWFDHKTNEAGSLDSLLKRDRAVLDTYDRARPDDAKVRAYLRTRSILKFPDTIGLKAQGDSIVLPLRAANGELVQLYRILLNPDGTKKGKAILKGKGYRDRAIHIKNGSDTVLVIEGLEDGLVINEQLKGAYDVLVAGGAVNFKKVTAFLPSYKDVKIILDNDTGQGSLVHSYHLGPHVERLLPVDEGIDANEALRQGWFDEWWETLEKIDFEKCEDAYKSTPSGQNADAIEELNEKHALVNVQGKIVIMTRTFDPMFDRHDLTLSNKTDFGTLYQNKFVETTEGKRIQYSDYWLGSRHRREYEGFKFDPTEKINGVQQPGPHFNLWSGFAVEPGVGKADLYYDHLYYNVAQGDSDIYEYMLNWMADAVQRPGVRPGVSIVLRGGSGVGKGAAIEHFCMLFGIGRHALQVSNIKHVVGSFNAHLANCLVLYADEAFNTRDKNHEAILKTLITEKVRVVEFKGKDAFQMPNFTRLMMSSNKKWIVPMEVDDRRFFITDVGTRNKQDTGYFGLMYEEMQYSGGLEQLLKDLLERDLSTVNVNAYPDTAAIRENKIASLPSVLEWLYYRLKDSPFSPDENIAELYRDYRDNAGKWYVSRSQWSQEITRVFGPLKRKQRHKEGIRYFDFPPLEALRAAFCKANDMGVDWHV